MLTSITPLGERSRGFSWPVTVAAFAIGAIATAVAAGAALGALGSLLPLGPDARAALAIAVLVAALAFDAPGRRLRLPSSRRQVNEDWLGRYRGWVYGLAFGAQLGAGVVTIVTSAAVYATWLLAFASGSAAVGAAIGAAFGAVRALSLLAARKVKQPSGLMAMGRALERWDARTRLLAPLVEVVALGSTVALI
jgi:hypothetical protein